MRLQSLLLGCAAAGLMWAGGAAQVAVPPGQARDAQVVNPAVGTGLIAGRITLAGTGQPVEEARVTLNGAELRGGRSVLTNDEGQFAFTELPAGTFTVRATLTGYIAGTFGQKAPGKPGTAIVMAAGQQLKDVSFEIAKGGVISGVVFDERSRPSIGTPVRVMRWQNQSGERTLASAGSATTDDRGMYRVYNLMPGEYLVTAVPRNSTAEFVTTVEMQRFEELRAQGLTGSVTFTATTPQGIPAGAEPALGYAPVFYPGTSDLAAARSIRVGIAEEQLGIDFALQRVRLSTITGYVSVPSGQSPTTVQVRLLQPEGNALGVGQISVRPSQNGAFTFRAVVPGQYIVFATATVAPPRGIEVPPVPQPAGMPPGQPSQRRIWAQTEVFVDGGPPPVVSLTMQEGQPVSGHLAFDGSAPLPQSPRRVRVTLNPLGQPLQSAGMGSWSTDVEASGRFTLHGVIPGRYRVSASGASGWQVKNVIVNGIDVLDFPFVVEPGAPTPELAIRFGDRHTDLRGRLTDASGAPAPEYSVVMFPDDQRYWVPFARRMRSARPNTDGTFTFGGLPPGDYRLAAVTDVETGEWLDPEFLRQLLPASISVRLADGQPTTQDIRVR